MLPQDKGKILVVIKVLMCKVTFGNWCQFLSPFCFHVPKNITTVIPPQVSTQFYLMWVTGTQDFVWQSPLFSRTQPLSPIARREENAGASSSMLSMCSSGQMREILK